MRTFVKKEVAIVGHRAWNFELQSNLQEVRSMKKKRLFPQIVFLCFILIFLFPLRSFSQHFPSKPITLYVGYEPGAATDITARVLGSEAEPFLGVTVVVENKAGGASSVAASLLASKKADGYTLGVISSAALTTVHILTRNLAYDPLKDFTYLFSYSDYMIALCVRTESPFKTLPELIEHARKNPEALSYSSSGTGNSAHLFAEHLSKQANVKFKHVPFKGGAPAYTALLGGHVDFTIGSGSHIPYVKQGLWRMLVIAHQEERDPNFPDVPTWKELGYKRLPGGASAIVLLAPKNLPDLVYKKLESGFTQAAYAPKFKKVLESRDMPFVFKDRRQWETDLPRDYKLSAEFLLELGLVKK
jgi:tripartite-type tricarboxylate transporter receptor subunit TctC